MCNVIMILMLSGCDNDSTNSSQKKSETDEIYETPRVMMDGPGHACVIFAFAASLLASKHPSVSVQGPASSVR